MFNFLFTLWFICWLVEIFNVLRIDCKKGGDLSFGFVVFVIIVTAFLGTMMLSVRILTFLWRVKK